MTHFASTIIIPEFGHPNLLHACLHAIVKHSVCRHRVLVIWSDPAVNVRPERPRAGRAWDFEIDAATGQVMQQRFDSLPAFAASHATWCAEHGIEFVDVTDRAREFYDRYTRGEIVPGKTHFEDGADFGFKANVGLDMTRTEWAMPNFDADFLVAPGWDRPLIDRARQLGPNGKTVLVPMHVQPRYHEVVPHWPDPWTDARRAVCHAMTLPTQRRASNGAEWVTEAEFVAYVERMRRPGEIIRERCGERTGIHWNPMLMPTNATRLSLQGVGVDVELDDDLGRKGYAKIGCLDSFQLHKGFPPIECSI